VYDFVVKKDGAFEHILANNVLSLPWGHWFS